ncbi:hypothetical protein [Bifidobacterium sp.]|uniref:hypothetical protein n=2 Tax=Bifidobacterium sp. TaxID=41200 RepID=UPI0025C5BC45|nr:hypothetical protein [Bifidobacterium sp.]MCH4208981.1 hypothetical protein [Bifidobacterium sp.]
MHGERHLMRALASVPALCLLVSLAACASPRLEGRAEAGINATPCGRAYQSASTAQAAMGTRNPRLVRFFAAAAAGRRWTEVAATCAQRFDEGTLRAAQAQYMAQALAASVGAAYAAPGTPRGGFDAVTGMDADSRTLRAVILAEDRAGFAVEFLAARKSPYASLSISDDHKATASRLFSLASAAIRGIVDPRQKVYSLSRLIAAPDTVIDDSTGLRAPTMAAVEIGCAREEIAGVDDLANKAQDTAGMPGDSTATRTNTLRALSRLAASRAALALACGYPSFDAALFE